MGLGLSLHHANPSWPMLPSVGAGAPHQRRVLGPGVSWCHPYPHDRRTWTGLLPPLRSGHSLPLRRLNGNRIPGSCTTAGRPGGLAERRPHGDVCLLRPSSPRACSGWFDCLQRDARHDAVSRVRDDVACPGRGRPCAGIGNSANVHGRYCQSVRLPSRPALRRRLRDPVTAIGPSLPTVRRMTAARTRMMPSTMRTHVGTAAAAMDWLQAASAPTPPSES